jgi:uncharacterized membrane protein
MPDPVQNGLSDNSIGAVAYITPVPALFFLAIAPYNRSANVRFHAWQSLMLSVMTAFLCWFLSFFPVFNLSVLPVILAGLSLPVLIVWAFISLWCALKALNGKHFLLPVIGPWSERQAVR